MEISRKLVAESAAMAADWLSDSALIRQPDSAFCGALKSTYSMQDQRWKFSEPFWHTAQAVRGWLDLSEELQFHQWDAPIDQAAGFLRQQIINAPNRPRIHGGIMHLEGKVDECVPSGALHATILTNGLEGLIDYHLARRDAESLAAIKRAAHWLGDVMLDDASGMVWSSLDMEREEYLKEELHRVNRLNRDNPDFFFKRPDAEGSALLLCGRLLDSPRLVGAFKKTLDFLVQDQAPDGIWWNWVCNAANPPRAHGRYNLWLAFAMLNGYAAFGDESYRMAAIRTARFYRQAQQLDGGISYLTTPDGKGLMLYPCGSAVAMSALLWLKLLSYEFDGDFARGVELSCEFLTATQYAREFADENLRGAYYESYGHARFAGMSYPMVRDIASVFGMQLMAKLLAGLRLSAVDTFGEWMESATRWQWKKWPSERLLDNNSGTSLAEKSL